MGFLSSSVSFVRYEVKGEKDPLLWENLPDILKQNSFSEIDEGVEELGVGWVSFDNLLDTQWEDSSPYRGEFVVFGFRMDRRKLSPAIFKKYYTLALDEFLEREGEKIRYIPRAIKQEIRENVRLKLLSRTLPIPAVFDVIWKFNDDLVYFSSINKGVRRLFEELFIKSFSLSLRPLTPWRSLKRLERTKGLSPIFSSPYKSEVFI